MSFIGAILRKVVQINGVSLTERRYFNFVSGATATDNPVTGATDIVCSGGSGTFSAGGDLTGSDSNQTVAKVKGTTITTAGGALPVGAVLRTTAVGTADWGTLDLADADARTGVLPTANQAAQTMGGDVGGTTASATITALAVSKLAAGTDTYVLTTTAGVPVWAAPAGGGSTPTGTGIPHIVSGVYNGATSLIVDADVNAAAAIAGSKIDPNFSGQTITTTGNIKLGSTPATSGNVRLPYQGSILANNSTSGANLNLIASASPDALSVWGTGANYGNASYFIGNGASASFETAAVFSCAFSSTNVRAGVPIIGHTGQASPYGAHGGFNHSFASDASYTLTAAQYALYDCEFSTGSWTSGHNCIFPHPASDAVGYTKRVINLTSYGITVSTGTGTTKSLSAGQSEVFRFASGGVTHGGSAVTP